MNTRDELLSSLLLFTKVFYQLRYNRNFELSLPPSRESHYLLIARAFTKVFLGDTKRLIINVPPRYGKTEMLISFVGWAMAHFPDSNFLYTSYSHSLATQQTKTIRKLLSLPEYNRLFGIQLSQDSSAKDNFELVQGGSVYAAGAMGSITGRGAGIDGCARFGGAVLIDDIHKPTEVFSDVIREGVKEWYLNTLRSRVNDPNTPIIFIGQRLHEDDLAGNLINGYDGHHWDLLSIPALDATGSPLLPRKHTREELLIMQQTMKYDFPAQYQQTPIPAGGGLFMRSDFILLDKEPEMLATFIVMDSAETSRTYNDATVLSFFGVYKMIINGIDSGHLGLHWIDCVETWIEPKDLHELFMDFYTSALRYPTKPLIAAIEKKSTGTFLISLVKEMRGLRIMDIDRTVASGSKAARFLAVQPYVAGKLVSLPMYGKHNEMCLKHMEKITANDAHRFDDIADTLTDGVRLGLIDKVIINPKAALETQSVIDRMAQLNARQAQARRTLWQPRTK